MNTADWNAFWAMGGYALYVWPSVGVFVGGLVVEWVATGRRRQRAIAAIRRRLAASGAPR